MNDPGEAIAVSPLEAWVARLLTTLASDLPDAQLAPEAWYRRHQALPLELASLQVMQLVDLIEASFEVVLSSLDVTRVHFATPAAIATRLRQRGVG